MSKEKLEWLNSKTLIGCTDSRGSNAWHYRADLQDGREPNHYPGPIPIGDVKRRLFDWNAVELPVFVARPAGMDDMTALNDEGEPIQFAQLTDRKAIAADDNYDVLGLFKSGYAVHQYEEWLLENVAAILDDNLVISSAGLLKNRAVAWVEVSVPDTLVTPEGFAFRPNLLAATSMDGSLATTYKRTVTATVCDNTLSVAVSESGGQIKYRHSKNSISRIADARLALEIVHSTADDFSAQVKALAESPVSNAEWDRIVEQLAPMDADSKRSVSMGQQKRDQLHSLYLSDPRVAPWAGTALGVLQATNTWEHHLKPVRGNTERSERNQMGALNGDFDRSDQRALELVGAGIALDGGGPGVGL